MPDRIIKDQARSSPTLQRLSDGAERAWWRLTVAADDYGRFDADPDVLLSRLFERKPAGWTVAKVRKVLEEWTDGDDPLVHLYQIAGEVRVYGHAVTFGEHQRERTSKPKFPDPPCGGSPQLAAKCRESLQLAARARALREPRAESREPRADVLSAAWPDPEALARKYNAETPEECPAVRMLPDGRLLSPSRRSKALEYLKLFPQEEFWTKAFQQVHKSKLLRGLKPNPGHEHFGFSFDWMLTKGSRDHVENIVKVAEGKYRD